MLKCYSIGDRCLIFVGSLHFVVTRFLVAMKDLNWVCVLG
jgi:hypothetical protein